MTLEPIRWYGEEEAPLLGWIRQGRYNVRAGRVAILDYVHPNVKVFDDELHLEFVAAVGDRTSPNEHGIADILLTDDGVVVVVTESGWILGLGRDQAFDLGRIQTDDLRDARPRLAGCRTGWAVVSEAPEGIVPLTVGASPERGSHETGRRRPPPPVWLSADPTGPVEAPVSRGDAVQFGAATTDLQDCELSRPHRLGPDVAIPAHMMREELLVFPDPSGGALVTLGGPGSWFAVGRLAQPGAGS